MVPGALPAAGIELKAPLSNIGMHPTRASMDVIENLNGFEVVCGRVMPGVRLLVE